MSCNTLIGLWATGIFDNLGQPANVAVTTISGYAVQTSTLGRLNNLIGTCYSGSGYAGNLTGAGSVNFDTVPDLTNSELALIEKMYLVSYYNNLAQATMGVGGSTIPWQVLKEEGSSITRVNAASIGAQYAQMSKDAQTQLWQLTNAYRSNGPGGAVPRDVEYLNIAAPTWGTSYLSP